MRRCRLVLILGTAATLAMLSCVTDPVERTYPLAADSITAPDTVAVTDPLVVQIHYTLPNGCHSLHRVNCSDVPDGVVCRLIGRKVNMMCDQMVRYRTWEITRSVLVPGTFTVEVDQPTGPHLVKEVVIIRDKGDG